MSMEESISLEETNKIRISLGLKPLTDDKGPANDPEARAQENYQKIRDAQAKEQKTRALQDRIAKVKNRRELNASLKGTTLGDVDDEVDDTRKWLKRSKKREKELAMKRQQELETMDKQFTAQYTEKDLEGLKVSHDFEALEDGEARILTLKDSRILDNEEDELQNVEMAEEDKRQKQTELKSKRHDYTGYDDDEFGQGMEGMKKSVLAKYDDELEGSHEIGFRLGATTAPTNAVAKRVEKERAATAVKKSLLSIDYEKNTEIADYLIEGDAGFKKPKAKKKRPSRRTADENSSALRDSEEAEMAGNQLLVKRTTNLNANFVDDDELQAALARSRRAKVHKAQKLSPEEIARKIAEEQMDDDTMQVTEASADGMEASAGLTFDDTSEFVRSIYYDPTAIKKEPAAYNLPHSGENAPRRPTTADVPMTDGDEAVYEMEAGEVAVKEEDEDEAAMLDDIEAAIKATEAEEKAAADHAVGTASEQSFDAGMASTLNILRQQGLLAPLSSDASEREKVQKRRDLWLAEQRRRVAERELERVRARGQNKDQATREYENRLREQAEARETLEAYKNYKPDVQIVYHDEYGRSLTPKEAWKALSHKFHGKGSGKMKTEKRLKKIAEEKKKESMASGDTPLSMTRAFQIRQEKAGQAHFVLSVGNRGAVPQAQQFLDAQPLTKGKAEKGKGKSKDASKGTPGQKQQAGGFMTLPQPSTIIGADPSPSPGLSRDSPAPKPGFSRIESASATDGPSEASSKERSKVVIGFGTKRKAGDVPSGTPPPKRR